MTDVALIITKGGRVIIHKSTPAPDGGYEIMCNYEKIKGRNSRMGDGKKYTYAWKPVTCKDCLRNEKIMREK